MPSLFLLVAGCHLKIDKNDAHTQWLSLFCSLGYCAIVPDRLYVHGISNTALSTLLWHDSEAYRDNTKTKTHCGLLKAGIYFGL